MIPKVVVNQQWKFEQERIVSRIPSMPLPGTPNRSSHLVLEALYDESRPAMPGTPVVLGVACQVQIVERKRQWKAERRKRSKG